VLVWGSNAARDAPAHQALGAGGRAGPPGQHSSFFVPVTIGLAFLAALLQTAWYRNKREE
jgi:hypothetical protein